MKKGALGVAALIVYNFIPDGKTPSANESGTPANNGKTLIVYFSHSGNTRYMAGQIRERIGGDVPEIRTVWVLCFYRSRLAKLYALA